MSYAKQIIKKHQSIQKAKYWYMFAEFLTAGSIFLFGYLFFSIV